MTIKISLDIQIDNFVYRSVLKTTIFAFFRPKKVEPQSNQFISSEKVNPEHGENQNFTRTDFTLKCDIIQSNYDVKHIQAWLSVW